MLERNKGGICHGPGERCIYLSLLQPFILVYLRFRQCSVYNLIICFGQPIQRQHDVYRVVSANYHSTSTAIHMRALLPVTLNRDMTYRFALFE